LDGKSQIDEIQSQSAKGGIVDCRRKGMVDRISQQAAQLGLCINVQNRCSRAYMANSDRKLSHNPAGKLN